MTKTKETNKHGVVEKESITEPETVIEHKKLEAGHETPIKEHSMFTKPILVLMALAVLLTFFNQYQIYSISGTTTGLASVRTSAYAGNKDLDLNELKSTGHTMAAVFPVEDIKTQEDAMAILFPTGTPDYGEALGVSFDNPIGSLSTLSKMYPGLKAEVQRDNPEGWKRFMNLASRPLGMSCEFCCGVGTIGIDKNGNSACGCQHNPAMLAVSLYLAAYTDYSDGEILREAMRWKTLFFPQKMIELGMTVAGGDTSALENLPGMVGGC